VSSAAPASLTEKAARLGRVVETTLLCAVLGAMIMLAAAQIALRNLAGSGIPWADEALRIMVLWVALLGAVAAGRDKRHVSIDAVSRYLPSGIRRGLARWIDAIAGLVCAALAWFSWVFLADSWSADERVLGGVVPAWAVQVILPVAFALMAYRYVLGAFLPGSSEPREPVGH